MTIESISHPLPLSEWDANNPKEPFYLELFGETRPFLDTAVAEVVSVGGSDASATGDPAPVYEYSWTIGHAGHVDHQGGFLHRTQRSKDLWDNLDDPAARVYLYLPLGGGWRIRELAASVKYMTPVAHEDSFMEKAAHDWQTIEPVVHGARELASLAGAFGIAAGGTAGRSAKLLDGIAQVKLESVPQIEGFEWSACKVTFASKQHGAVMQGVRWTLTRSMFAELGGRLTGSLVVSLIPDCTQTPGRVATQYSQPEQRPLLGHAVVYEQGGVEHWAPARREFIGLEIAPRLAASERPPRRADPGRASRRAAGGPFGVLAPNSA